MLWRRQGTDAAYRSIVLDFRERTANGDATAHSIMQLRTEDDFSRAVSMLMALGRLSDKLQLFANRLSSDDWLGRRNKRSFRYHRDLVYIFG